jgi:thioredoxin 1
MGLLSLLKSMFHSVPAIPPEEFLQRWQEASGPLLVDVRTAGEFKQGTLLGAQNIDVMSVQFKSQIEALPQGKQVFVLCRSGGRSRVASAKLRQLGFEVFELAGGFGAWQSSGLKWKQR